MGNGKAAVSDFQAAIAKVPSAALPHFHLAQAYQSIGEQQPARAAFDRAKSLGLEVDSLHPYEREAYRDLSERLGDR
jgi:Tfp pilus assembly protein PilF